jgi:uroporphyrinogen-III decarboxylase
MTSKERMRATMCGNRPDRVPVMCQLSLGHIYKNASMDPVSFWYTSKGLAEEFVTMAERYRFDGILINTSGRNPDILKQIDAVEPYIDGHKIIWTNGDQTYLPPNDDPLPINKARTIRKRISIEDIDIEAIKVYRTVQDLPVYYTDILDHIIRLKGNELSIHGEIGTVFERLLVLFNSYSDGLIALMDDPDKCKRIMERMNESCITEARVQCAKGIDVLKLSSPFAGSGFISRKMYREFVLPYEKQVINCVTREFNIPCYIHTCGAIGDRLDLMVETGTKGIECLDPYPLGDVDLGKAVEEIGDKVFFKGNLDSVNELLYHTPAEVKEIARKRIEIGKQSKIGYILSSACSVSPGVPPENILTLYDAVELYGQYSV